MMINADARSIPLASGSVQCIVTSPPYWNLRDYGTDDQLGLEKLHDCLGWATGENCESCYICHMRQVFSELWRVLRDDGTAWLNIGDSYAGSGKGFDADGNQHAGEKQKGNRAWDIDRSKRLSSRWGGGNALAGNGLKAKDLVGIPWRLALALQKDGWFLRSDVIWCKPNGMPESVKDRPTRNHEYVFLLSKQKSYYYDHEAIQEPAKEWTGQAATFQRNEDKATHTQVPGQRYTQHRADRKQDQVGKRQYTGFNDRWANKTPKQTRNCRSVWEIPTQPTHIPHFATFPEKLVEAPILAGCPPGGIVFDPFAGSGTTGRVALRLGRRFVGTELSFKYIQTISRERLSVQLGIVGVIG